MLSKQYAYAFFNYLKTPQLQEEFLTLLESLMPLFKNRSFYSFFSLPFVLLAQKQRFLTTLVDKKFLPFFLILLRKEAFLELPAIFKMYQKLRQEREKIKRVILCSPVTLELNFLELLKVKLENFYQKSVYLQLKIDPSLIGGALLITDNQILDFSIKRFLSHLQVKLLAVTF